MKSRGVAILLAIFLGGFGIHRFYLGQLGRGLLFLFFFWTFIPAIIALIDAIRLAVMGEQSFHERYNAYLIGALKNHAYPVNTDTH